MSEYQACYRLEKNEEFIPIVFVSKKDATEYLRKTGLTGYYLHRETQSGDSDYKIAV